MSVLVMGLSHRSASVEVLERAAVATDEIPKLLDEMLRGSHVTEVMMLSTCNRIEVYAVVDALDAASRTRISATFCSTCREKTYCAGRCCVSGISGAIAPSVRTPRKPTASARRGWRTASCTAEAS